MITFLFSLKNFFISEIFCEKIVFGMNLEYFAEKSFSEILRIEVGSFIIFILSFNKSNMCVDVIYSRLNGGS